MKEGEKTLDTKIFLYNKIYFSFNLIFAPRNGRTRDAFVRNAWTKNCEIDTLQRHKRGFEYYLSMDVRNWRGYELYCSVHGIFIGLWVEIFCFPTRSSLFFFSFFRHSRRKTNFFWSPSHCRLSIGWMGLNGTFLRGLGV